MRIARKLMLLAVMAAAAMAFAVPQASANVEVSNEATGVHCGAVTLAAGAHEAAGGCELEAHSVGVVNLELFGATVSQCLNEFEGRVDENGEGWIYHQVLTPGAGTNCPTTPCVEAGGAPRPWRAHLNETAANEETMTVAFCVVQSGGERNCTLNVDFDQPSHSEGTFETHNSSHVEAERLCSNNPFLGVRGHWAVETGVHPDLEVTHPF